MAHCSPFFKILLAGVSAFSFSHCGSNVHMREKNAPIHDLDHYKEALEQDASVSIARFETIHRDILKARKLERRRPKEAIAYYLQAAETAWSSRDAALLPLYNHAVGQVADLVKVLDVSQSTVFQTASQAFTLQFDPSDVVHFPVSEFDDLIPVDCLKREGMRSEVAQSGVGAPMVALHGTQGRNENPFISPVGGDFNVTALIDFSKKGKPLLQFYDVTKVHSVEFWGKEQPLAINLSASYYVSADRKSAGGGASRIMGVFRPMKYSGRMGLYLEPRFDPDKIPLIFVHGLVSSPLTWADPINELMADPVIRENYQPYVYYYPTGFPVRMTGGKLKEDLLRLDAYAREHGAGAGDKVDKSVIMGHSMGGLLTSMNVREIDESTWSKISNKPIEELPLSRTMKEDYVTIFQKPQPPGIKRAVFIATPHRGSNKANTWYGGFVATLIKIPNNIAQLDLIGMTQSMTDLGKSLFNQDGPVNSMVTLKQGNPALELVAGRPILERVPYHSIIGDRGKGDTPNSSDGVVPYSSSHLEGAESELIVPSGHSAHRDPAAIKEMQRILREHLKKNP